MTPSTLPISPRIFRVHGSQYWGDEVTLSPQTHTDERLEMVAKLGYDGVWIHGELRQLAPTGLFEEFEPDSRPRVAALQTVIARAHKHGIGVWLYMSEPRSYAVDHPFWKKHPECQGHLFKSGTDIGWRWHQVRGPLYGMCLSAAPVREFMRASSEQMFRETPGLAGAIVITASEHHGHCYMRFKPGQETMTCPRCAKREPWEMPVEVAREMKAGLDASGAKSRLCFWNWAWDRHLEPGPTPNIIANLPEGVALMGAYEMGDVGTRAGKAIELGEYSFSFTGPAKTFRGQAELAQKRGLEVWAKLTVNATHEIASMPNIPLPGVLYDKIAGCRDMGVRGVMSVWTMALLPTLNSFTAARLMAHDGELTSRDDFLRGLAREYFGVTDATVAEGLRAGWSAFSRAIAHHPMEVNFLYFSPMNYAPAYPWRLKREGTRMARSWKEEPWGDMLEMSLHRLTIADDAMELDRMATIWEEGLAPYRKALAPISRQNRRAWEELNVAEACGLFFRLCADAYLFYDAVTRSAPGAELLKLIDREMATCERVIPLLAADPRLGWHDDFQKQVCNPQGVREKIASLEALRGEISGEKQSG